MLYMGKEPIKIKMSLAYAWPLIAILFFTAVLHASFQLGVSLLTILSSHSLGSQRSHTQLLKLNIAYVSGVGFITTLIFASLAYTAASLTYPREPLIWWIVVASLNLGIGLAVSFFYYRKGKGTELWLPRKFAQYLAARTKKTHHSAEAFGLGMASVICELLFIIGPLSVAALYSIRYPPPYQLVGLIFYVIVALLPLLVIVAMIGAGQKVSTIQRWRERNKRFLQYAAGSGLIILGLYLFIAEVVTVLALDGATII